jgi:hypothetical protein
LHCQTHPRTVIPSGAARLFLPHGLCAPGRVVEGSRLVQAEIEIIDT